MQASRRLKNGLVLAIGSLLFAVAHTQAPLYYSNQNQYFLHGLAAAGAGNLDSDWLANTVDPTPIFSGLVTFTARHVHVFAFHLLFVLLLAIYFVSLLAIGGLFVSEGPSRQFALFALGTMLIVSHAGLLRLASVQATGVDYSWYLQSGVAGQYALGPGLQPSAFGVLLLGSVAAFAHRRLVLAVACSVGACWLHATYLLPAAICTLSYMIGLHRDGRSRAAMLMGAGSFLSVLPVVIVSAQSFAPTDWEAFRQAEVIVAEFRIPHHTLIRRWLDPAATAQLVWIGAALMLIRKTVLFRVLGLAALCSLLLTLLQAATHNLTLALMFPWRMSIVLVPIATCIIFVKLAAGIPDCRLARWAGGALLMLAVLGGIFIQMNGLAYHQNDNELPALEFVRTNKKSGDLYLIPIRVPTDLQRGSVSTSFTSPPGSQEPHLIAVDLLRFRLWTEAPIYVDFKSIPYKDTEVLEWYRRVRECQQWYAVNDWNSANIRQGLRRQGITHVLTRAEPPINVGGFEEIHSDRYYRIYRIVPD